MPMYLGLLRLRLPLMIIGKLIDYRGALADISRAIKISQNNAEFYESDSYVHIRACTKSTDACIKISKLSMA